MTTLSTTRFAVRPSRFWRALGLTLLGMVLILSFLAYLSPDMLLQWDTLAALCGF